MWIFEKLQIYLSKMGFVDYTYITFEAICTARLSHTHMVCSCHILLPLSPPRPRQRREVMKGEEEGKQRKSCRSKKRSSFGSSSVGNDICLLRAEKSFQLGRKGKKAGEGPTDRFPVFLGKVLNRESYPLYQGVRFD